MLLYHSSQVYKGCWYECFYKGIYKIYHNIGLLSAPLNSQNFKIIGILKKQKQEFKNLYIEVEGKREDGELPSLFTQIHADVFIEGEVDSKKAYKASELSFTKYCSVSKTLEATADISFSVYVNNKICSK